MNKIESLPTRIARSGRTVSYSLFVCPYCSSKVAKPTWSGKYAQSCGCAKGFLIAKKKNNRGESKTSLYWRWKSMMRRCYFKDIRTYNNYGGRGIVVCKGWHDYNTFKIWALKSGYKGDLQLDRKENDGDYTPENCRFVSRIENVRNSRKAKLSAKDVQEIRDLYESGQFTKSGLASLYKVRPQNIHSIVIRKIWKDV